MSEQQLPSSSPPWSPTAKLVIGLTIVGLVAVLIIYFRAILGPLIMAFMLVYLLHPLVANFSRATHLSWRISVNLIYLILVILLAGFFTISGLAIVQQLQSLIRVVQNFVNTLPDLVADISTRVYTFGPLPFKFSLNQFDLQTLTEQLLSTLQPLLGRVGTLVGTLATSALTTLRWGLFILLISYFILADAGQVPNDLFHIEIPGYDTDIRRLGRDLTSIWNAFLRGQLILFILAVLSYLTLMNILGLRYALGIAILAGLSRFVPYIGPFTTWTVTILVAIFQPSNYFGLQPYQYALLVIIIAIVIDQIFDNFISPRILGETLGVHPAAVLVAALVAARLIGVIGILLAAPALASLMLLWRYTVRKMLDVDPWPKDEPVGRDVELPWEQVTQRLKDWWESRQREKPED